MATIANLTVRLTAQTDPLSRALKGAEAQIASFKRSFGKNSAIGEIGDIFQGTGAIAGLAGAVFLLKDLSAGAKNLSEQLRSGEMASADIGVSLMKSIPILGQMIEAAENFQTAITGGDRGLGEITDKAGALYQSLVKESKLAGLEGAERVQVESAEKLRNTLAEIGALRQRASTQGFSHLVFQLDKAADLARIVHDKTLAALRADSDTTFAGMLQQLDSQRDAMTKTPVELMTAKGLAAGLGGDQLAALTAAAERNEQLKKSVDLTRQMTSAGEALRTAYRSPLESFTEEMSRIDALFKGGFIDNMTRLRAEGDLLIKRDATAFGTAVDDLVGQIERFGKTAAEIAQLDLLDLGGTELEAGLIGQLTASLEEMQTLQATIQSARSLRSVPAAELGSVEAATIFSNAANGVARASAETVLRQQLEVQRAQFRELVVQSRLAQETATNERRRADGYGNNWLGAGLDGN